MYVCACRRCAAQSMEKVAQFFRTFSEHMKETRCLPTTHHTFTIARGCSAIIINIKNYTGQPKNLGRKDGPCNRSVCMYQLLKLVLEVRVLTLQRPQRLHLPLFNPFQLSLPPPRPLLPPPPLLFPQLGLSLLR